MPSSLSKRLAPLCPGHYCHSISPSLAADSWSFWHFKIVYPAPSSKHASCRYSQPPTALGALCFEGAPSSGFPTSDLITQALDNPAVPITYISYLFEELPGYNEYLSFQKQNISVVLTHLEVCCLKTGCRQPTS